jgi:hypothetical protein
MNLQLTLNSSAKHIWSLSTGYITNIQLNSITNASLLYKVTQPNAIEASKIPPYVLYPYKEYNYYLTSQGNTITSGSTVTATTSSINFGRVPHRISIGVRKLDKHRTGMIVKASCQSVMSIFHLVLVKLVCYPVLVNANYG